MIFLTELLYSIIIFIQTLSHNISPQTPIFYVSLMCSSYSNEVVLSNDGCKVVLGSGLWRCGKSLEFFESNRVVSALLKQVKLWLANSHLAIQFKEAFSCIIESLQTYWLKCQTNIVERVSTLVK